MNKYPPIPKGYRRLSKESKIKCGVGQLFYSPYYKKYESVTSSQYSCVDGLRVSDTRYGYYFTKNRGKS